MDRHPRHRRIKGVSLVFLGIFLSKNCIDDISLYNFTVKPILDIFKVANQRGCARH